MRTKPAYLVIDVWPNSGLPRIRRVQQSWPNLDPGEVCLRLTIELPDSLARPVATELEVAERDLTLAVEVVEREPAGDAS